MVRTPLTGKDTAVTIAFHRASVKLFTIIALFLQGMPDKIVSTGGVIHECVPSMVFGIVVSASASEWLQQAFQ
jgi:hypothetical protein